MNYALIIIYILIGIELLYVSNQHGEERVPFNIWSAILGNAIWLTLVLLAINHNNIC